jgi:hypothetical protein
MQWETKYAMPYLVIHIVPTDISALENLAAIIPAALTEGEKLSWGFSCLISFSLLFSLFPSSVISLLAFLF